MEYLKGARSRLRCENYRDSAAFGEMQTFICSSPAITATHKLVYDLRTHEIVVINDLITVSMESNILSAFKFLCYAYLIGHIFLEAR
jgi:hypothetical protein